ncbi:MAG: glycosyltransferase [Phycisphaerales bacterium]|nr:glycosyltransferase [Phycisphaerales bacterium]
MRFALITSGSHGDVHPFLGIGAELRRRGHGVTLFTHPYFSRNAAAVDLEFEPIYGHFDLEGFMRTHMHLPPAALGMAIFREIIGGVPAAIEASRRVLAVNRYDAVLSHVISIGTRWVCEERGIPQAMATLAPVFWLSPHDPAPAIQKHPGPIRRRISQAAIPMLRPLVSLVADWQLSNVRRACGFPRERGGALRDMHGGALNLGLWSPTVRPKITGDPRNGRVTGFVWHDGSTSAATSAALEAFYDRGPPPVVFSLGTAHVHSPGAFYDIAAEACRRIGIRGVLLVGSNSAGIRSDDTALLVADYAPFSQILPRSAALVHHGGAGTTAQALRAAIPQLIVPQGNDQFNNALRVHQLGAGGMIFKRGLTPAKLGHALSRLLADQALAHRAKSLAWSIQSENGAAEAADALEEISRIAPVRRE